MPLFIGCEFWVKSRCQNITQAHRDNKLVASRCGKPGKRLYTLPHSRDDRCTNKNDWRRSCTFARERGFQHSLKAVHLTPEVITVDGHIQPAEQRLSANFLVFDMLGQKNHAGAGTPYRLSGFYPDPQRFQQAQALCNQPHGSAFAARNNDAIQAIELCRGAHLDHINMQLPQNSCVFRKCALQCKNANS